jgi:hypothetical protein
MSVFYIIKTAYKNLPWSFINTPETILNNCIKMKKEKPKREIALPYKFLNILTKSAWSSLPFEFSNSGNSGRLTSLPEYTCQSTEP